MFTTRALLRALLASPLTYALAMIVLGSLLAGLAVALDDHRSAAVTATTTEPVTCRCVCACPTDGGDR